MHDVRDFNWRIVVAVVIFLGFILYPFRDLFTVYEKFQEKIIVNDRLALYITQVEASSLSRDTFHFISMMRKKALKILCLTYQISNLSWLPTMLKPQQR
jgi:hypothetical protein